MNEQTKIATTIELLLISALYVVILSFFLDLLLGSAIMSAIITLGSLILIVVIAWGYGLKMKFLGSEIWLNPAETVMRRASTIREDRTGEEAEGMMEKIDGDFIAVVDGENRLKGIFTRYDADKARMRKELGSKLVDIMTPYDKIVKVSEREILSEIIEKIGKTAHSKLPVVNKDGKVIGIVTSVDISHLLSKVQKYAQYS